MFKQIATYLRGSTQKERTQMVRMLCTIALFLALFLGWSVILLQGRPVVSLQEDTPQGELVFSMDDVVAHGTAESCWAAIHGEVYDLTSWISRHPGGARHIRSLCGTDGSEAFANMHGGSDSAQAALVLLRIGTLK